MNDSLRAFVAIAGLCVAFSATSLRAFADQTSPPPAATPSPTASPQTAASLYAQAQLDAASGRNQIARDEVTKSLALQPGNLDALRLLGDVEYRLEHFAAAETAYKAVLARVPGDRNVHNRLGGVYAAENRIDDAITQFKLSLPLQEGTMNLVQIYQEEGKLGELEAEDQSEMDRSPADDPYTRFELAWVLSTEKRYNEAIALYQAALGIMPNFWEARNGLGIAYGELGRYADAISQYKLALQSQPRCYQCVMNWGVELINSGDPSGAIQYINKAIAINSQFSLAYMNLGVAYDNLGNFQRAIELYQQALVYDPRVPEVYYNLGDDYFERGLMSLAEAAFVKGIAVDPRSALLHLALGYYYQDRHQYQRAVDEYKLAMAYDPTDPRPQNYLKQVQALMGH